MRRLAIAICAAAVGTCAPVRAAADAGPDSDDDPDLDWSYLWDGGIVPFVYVPAAARIGLFFVNAPDSPRLFSPSEGGAPVADWEVPGWAVSSLGVGAGIGFLIGGDPSRWYHVKGLGESLVTGALVTGALKVTFGRRRPDYVSNDVAEGNRSFPSGHATQAFAIATYSILYLRLHAFDRCRPEGGMLWWEAASYLGILAGATAIASERLIHNRHHLSDVVVGGLLGTASAIGFFAYQERRYRRRHGGLDRVTVLPTVSSEGLGVQLGWTY